MSELEIWNELGNIYFNTGAYDEAIRTYQKAIELGHGCGQSYSNLASIYVRQGLYADAIPMLKKGIEILDDARSKACLWNQMGEAYRKLKDYDNATASYRKAALLDPENTAFQDNLEEAELDWESVYSQPTTGAGQPVEEITAPAMEETGHDGAGPEFSPSLPEINEHPEAEAVSWVFKDTRLTAVVEENVSGTHAPTPVILGSRILSPASGQAGGAETPGRLEEANMPIHDIPGKNSSDPLDGISPTGQPETGESDNERAHALLRLGILHWRKKEYERAIRFLEIALDTVVRPKDNFLEALCYNAIALVETDLGRIVDAIQAYQSAASLAPERIFPWNSLGNLNCMLERYDDALAAFQEGVEHNPKDATSWNGLGDVYHKLGRNEDAIAAYQLGNVFEKQVLDEDALKAYEARIETSRWNPLVWNEAGNIYYDTGAYGDAIASYQKAIELDPTNATFRTNLAKAELAMGLAGSGDATPNPESMSGTLQGNPLQTGHDITKTAPSDSTGAGSNCEDETIPTGSSTRPDKSTNHKFEAPYWIFNTEASLESALQPAKQYSTVGAETVAGSPKSLPAYTAPSHNQRTFPNGRMLPGANANPSALMVQLTPRAAQPAGTEEKVRPSIQKEDWKSASSAVDSEPHTSSACTAEADTNTPALQAAASGDQAAGQAPIDFHVLEGDIAAYRRVTEINPNNDRAWDALGNMYEAAGLHSEAIAAFEQAIALGPRKEAYHYHLAIVLAYQTHYDKAIQALQNVLALNPNYVLAHCALASYYRRVGKEAEAQEHIAFARPTMEYEKEYNRACFESISGNTDQAFALLETALEKQQIQADMLRSDPDLDFIRSDARFEALLSKIMNVGR